MALTVIKPGAMTTIQDLGRKGYQHLGVPVSGAMDGFALQVANVIVGNSADLAVLEMTLIGPTLKTDSPMTVCITGADIEVLANGQKLPMWASIDIEANTILKFGIAKNGCRSYLAVSGGIQGKTVLGSQSTLAHLGLTPLRIGDVIMCDQVESIKNKAQVSPFALENIYSQGTFRVIPSRDFDSFTTGSREIFLKESFSVSQNSNRMGYRLSGNKVFQPEGFCRKSEGVAFGTIQITPDGNMIILTADRQTTGGYPTIGTVASCDHPRLAQLKPSDKMSFSICSAEWAAKENQQLSNFINQVKSAVF